MAEVELVLVELSGARKRAARAARELAKDGAEPHLVEPMERAEHELDATIDAFFKGRYFHVPKDQLATSTMAVRSGRSASPLLTSCRSFASSRPPRL